MSSLLRPHLALGTAQLGFDYGVTNSSGRIKLSVAKQLLRQSELFGVEFIDTAHSYGVSEEVIGKTLNHNNPFRIVSKLASQSHSAPWNGASYIEWQQLFDDGLKRLGVTRLDSFLLHDPNDLLLPQSDELLNWLKSLRYSGFVDRIGISIYHDTDLESLPLSDFQIVQLPCSIYDQRLISSGAVDYLRSFGISIHARSIFLQGLILSTPSHWPSIISAPFRDHHSNFESWVAGNHTSLLRACLYWAQQQSWIEAVVVGVTSLSELHDLFTEWNSSVTLDIDCLNSWSWANGDDLDPRTWLEQ